MRTREVASNPSRNLGKIRTLLDVPFTEKDEAKALGARWDPILRRWYCPSGIDPLVFDQWLPVSLKDWEQIDDDPFRIKGRRIVGKGYRKLDLCRSCAANPPWKDLCAACSRNNGMNDGLGAVPPQPTFNGERNERRTC
jgi:hypothetical protein